MKQHMIIKQSLVTILYSKKNISFSEYDILYNNVTISMGTKNEAIQLKCNKTEGESDDDLYYTNNK